ncbi:MAG: S41 family peptidase [Planctomycetaceae bacterium]|jgi:carboxyl-terminal processing protease|nr:S41 family peptidase [Planctomycetaceae bacterium]
MSNTNIRILFFTVLICVICATRASRRDWVLLDALHRIERESFYATRDKSKFADSLVESAINGMTDFLNNSGDKYAQYIPDKLMHEFQNELSSRYEGIGVMLQPNEANHTYTILFAYPNSPAWNVGLRHGDTILAVDGVEINEENFSDITTHVRGKPNTEVKLKILKAGKTEPHEIAVKRASLQSKTVCGDTITADGVICFTLETEPTIAYLNMQSSFIETTAGEMQDAIKSLPANVRGMIIDLRNNPGGYLDSCVAITNMFVKPNDNFTDIVTTRNRNKQIRSRFTASEKTLFDLPMAVLLNDNSASASEIMAAALQDFGRAKIIGTRSYGKGIVQEMFFLPRGYGIIKLTNSSYWRPSGKNIQRIDGTENGWGVMPDEDGTVEVTEDQRLLTDFIRRCRSLTPDVDTEEMLQLAMQNMKIIKAQKQKEEQDKKDVENKKGEQKEDEKEKEEQAKTEPFTPQGNSPYYDPQLDHAVIELKKMIGEE